MEHSIEDLIQDLQGTILFLSRKMKFAKRPPTADRIKSLANLCNALSKLKKEARASMGGGESELTPEEYAEQYGDPEYKEAMAQEMLWSPNPEEDEDGESIDEDDNETLDDAEIDDLLQQV